MIHEPECVELTEKHGFDEWCFCDSLRSAYLRGYEQAQREALAAAELDRLRAYENGCKVGLATAVQRVEALPWTSGSVLSFNPRETVISAIKGENS